MQNMWEVIDRLIDGKPMSEAEKNQAHALVETHLAQHKGIAAQLGEHREDIRALKAQAVAGS